MQKNTVLNFWERHSRFTHQFFDSPVKDVRLDILSSGKTIGCIVGITLDVNIILEKGGIQLLKSIIDSDADLKSNRFSELLTGNAASSDSFDGKWLPSIVSQSHLYSVVPHSSNIIFIKMIEADRCLRGSGIGHHLIKRLAMALHKNYPLCLLEAYPVDYKMNMTGDELSEGQIQLTKHYQKIGFCEVESGVMVASSQSLAGLVLRSYSDMNNSQPNLELVGN